MEVTGREPVKAQHNCKQEDVELKHSFTEIAVEHQTAHTHEEITSKQCIAAMGWKVESKSHGRPPRTKYTAPNGKVFYSIEKVINYLREQEGMPREENIRSPPQVKIKSQRRESAHPSARSYSYVQLTEYEKLLQQIFGNTVAHGEGSRTINQLDTNTHVEVTNLNGSQSPMHRFGFGNDDTAESISPKLPQTSDSRRRKSQSKENSGRTPKSRRSVTDGFLDVVNNFASIINKQDEKEELIFKQCIEALDGCQ
ncbi:hypothetical protein QJS10_CPA07g01126 [Acorus calamus]|uniref:DUF7028 domain-containing protein n=1 Tax=Acorus calamus TaxID=4465 RepID=A0AAV9EG10_ACOCL|nr:hypothetical protein QJS10_CPA07g01126 [Acorus calamus]